MTDETLHTVFCEVEAILNDRPISQNNSCLGDYPALTPNMLLSPAAQLRLPDYFMKKTSTQSAIEDVHNTLKMCSGSAGFTSMSKDFNRDQSGLESNHLWRRTTSCLLLTRTRLAVTGHLDESWNSTEATMATFDRLKFVFVEKNSFVQFLDCAFSNSTTDVTCLFLFIFFLVKFSFCKHLRGRCKIVQSVFFLK